MTIAQIYAVVALLLAFNVPTNTVQNIQTMLENTQPVAQQDTQITPPVTTATEPLSATPAPSSAPIATYTTLLRSDNGSYQPSSSNELTVGEMAYFDIHASDPNVPSENLTYTWTTNVQKYNDAGNWNKNGGLQFAYAPEKVGTTTLTFTISNGTDTTSLPIDVVIKTKD